MLLRRFCTHFKGFFNECHCRNGLPVDIAHGTCIRDDAYICQSCNTDFELTTGSEGPTCKRKDGWLPILEDYNYVLVTSGTCQDLNVAAIALPGFMYDMTFNPYLKNEQLPRGARSMCNYAANTIYSKNYILASSNPTLITFSKQTYSLKPAGCSIDAEQATVATTGLYWNPIQDSTIRCNGSNNQCVCAVRKYVVITTGILFYFSLNNCIK